MIGQMIRACGADDVAVSVSAKVRKKAISDDR
jgi:hypothetical protein